MRIMYSLVCLSAILMACETKVDNSANEAFEKNSQTVLTNLKNWEKEKVDYSQYADNFVMRGTGYGDNDSISLADMKAMDAQFLGMLDFRIASDSIVLLPGVDPVTKLPDGSVRHYTDWEIILPATDSTKARSAILKLYESVDFDAEGKIVFQQGYGDFGGIMNYLMSEEDTVHDEGVEEHHEN